MQWDLVCRNSFWLPTTQLVTMVGLAIGIPLCGHLSDVFGRRPVIWWTTVPGLLIAVAQSAVPSYWMLMVLRFLQGGLSAGQYTALFVLSKNARFSKRSFLHSECISYRHGDYQASL